MNSFHDFGLAEPITRALADENYVTPTPIQTQTIPLVMGGRDVIGIAQTGTGKTAAFALPILNHMLAKRLRPERKACRVLVLSPTRELSGQIGDSFRTYGRHIRPLAVSLAIGGVPINQQIRDLSHGVEVLVATPGRLLDLVNQRALRLDKVEVLVLDEADRMLDMGFIHDIRKVVSMLPKDRQTLFFSATMPQEITRLADAMLRDPARVAVTPQASTVEKVDQRVILTDRAAKPGLLAEMLKSEKIDRVLVFTRTKHGADKVVRGLQKAGLKAEAIHGNKSQSQRERVLAAFRDGQRAHAGRHRHRRARHRRRRHQPRGQLRPAEYSRKLCPPHRPHRARRRRGRRHLVLRLRGSAVPARHRTADPHDDPGDRPPHRAPPGPAAGGGAPRQW